MRSMAKFLMEQSQKYHEGENPKTKFRQSHFLARIDRRTYRRTSNY